MSSLKKRMIPIVISKIVKKNPGHLNFIPVQEFSVDSLPPGYRDNDLVDLVHAMADLTVCVVVECVSDKRLEIYPESGTPDPLFKHKDDKIMALGTGWVDEVEISSKNADCNCKQCLNSPTPNKQFANIMVRTAAHVVYDNIEAVETTCHFFYDSGAWPPASGGIALRGLTRNRNNTSIDFCELVYVTHDIKFADRLTRTLDTRKELRESVNIKNRSSSSFEEQMHFPGEEEPQSVHKLTIIVSHPHGMSKRVSIGEWVKKTCKEEEDDFIMYSYNTATCPGSSGAPVLLFGREWMNWWINFHHLGVTNRLVRLNRSNYLLDG